MTAEIYLTASWPPRAIFVTVAGVSATSLPLFHTGHGLEALVHTSLTGHLRHVQAHVGHFQHVAASQAVPGVHHAVVTKGHGQPAASSSGTRVMPRRLG
jgi:hypothetical protein